MFRLVPSIVAGMPVSEVSRGIGKGGRGKTRAQRRSGLASAALLGMMGPSLVFAAVVADPNGGAQRPDMTTTANGTDLVNIVAPNAAGLSHNKFSEFSPVGRGVVLNNSVQPGESQIGGQAMRNPNLTQPAKAALLEVTQQRSALQGTLEAFGGKLDVVVANQHGVTINGLTTLNVGRLGVTTGQVLPQADGTLRVGVTQGDVLIDHGGIDTKGLNMFDVVSRNIVVTGPISDSSGVGADVRLVAGMNTYDPRTGQDAATAPDGAKAPALGISGGALGAMYGRHIVLASTESGVGVRHDGAITSMNDIQVNANGEVTLGGPLRAARQVTIEASQAGSSASVQDVSADGAVIVSAGGHVAINGAAAAGADVVLLGSRVTAGQMSAQRDVLVMAADEVKFNGPVNAQRDVLVDAQGDVAGSEWVKAGRNVQAGAAANPAGAVEVEDMQQLKAQGDVANRRRVKAGQNEQVGTAAKLPAAGGQTAALTEPTREVEVGGDWLSRSDGAPGMPTTLSGASEQVISDDPTMESAQSARSTATAGGHSGSFIRLGDSHIAKLTTPREAETYVRYRGLLRGVVPDTVSLEGGNELPGVTFRQKRALQELREWANWNDKRVIVMQALGAKIRTEDKIELDIKIGASTVSRTELIRSGSTRLQAMSKKARLTTADLLRRSRSLVGDDRGYTLAGRTIGGIALDAKSSRNSVGRSSESRIREMLDCSPDTRWQNAQHLLGQLKTIRQTMIELPLTFVASSVLISIDKRNPENSVARLIDLAHPVLPSENDDYEKVNRRFENGLNKLITLFEQVEK
ncbi:inositol polyphosphate kinase family protein [Burkholderia sp. DN3021]|uniref:inositol polyphosphate kinase family protein n=1 Tax=Burkholderia sp. DN3021 TaxID=3410137 RepID=UPI003C7C8E84